MLLRRKRKKSDFSKRRDVLHRYIGEVVEAARSIAVFNKDDFRKSLLALAETHTLQADMEFDDTGNVIKKATASNDLGLSNTIVVQRETSEPTPQELFDNVRARKKPTRRKKITRKRR